MTEGMASGGTQRGTGTPDQPGRGIPAFVWAVTVLHTLVMLVGVGFWAPNRGPDEFRHVALSAAVASGAAWPWPDPGTLTTTTGVSAGLLSPSMATGKTLYRAREAPHTRADWPSYVDRGGDTPGSKANQLVQHPPTFYLLMGAALHLLPDWAHRPYIDVYLLLRIVNVLLLAPLPLLVFATGRRLLSTGPAPLAAAAGVLVIPQLSREGASVENDNLMILALVVLAWLSARVLTGDTSVRTALGIGAMGVLALLTKGLALFLPLYLVVVYAVARRRHGRGAIVPGLVALVVTCVGGGWWWLRNLVLFGVVQPDGTQLQQQGKGPPITSFGESGLSFLGGFANRFSYRFWMDADIWGPPHWVQVADGVLTVVLLAAIVAGVRAAGRWPGTDRVDAAVLLLPALLQLGIVLVGAWGAWAATMEPNGQQGRYVYGGLVGLLVVAAAGATRVLGARARFLPLALVAGGLLLQLVQLALGFRIYYTPARYRGIGHDLVVGMRNLHAWSPMPATAYWVVLAATAVAACATLALAARAVSVRPRRTPGPIGA